MGFRCPAVDRPDPNRPWYVRVLDSTGDVRHVRERTFYFVCYRPEGRNYLRSSFSKRMVRLRRSYRKWRGDIFEDEILFLRRYICGAKILRKEFSIFEDITSGFKIIRQSFFFSTRKVKNLTPFSSSNPFSSQLVLARSSKDPSFYRYHSSKIGSKIEIGLLTERLYHFASLDIPNMPYVYFFYRYKYAPIHESAGRSEERP